MKPVDELYALPERFSAGTTVTYLRSLSRYPAADGWALTLHLAGRSKLSVAAVVEGLYHRITIPAASTAGLKPGTYRWAERAALDGAEYEAATGTAEVTLDLATATEGEAQTEAEFLLELVNLRLRGRMTSDMESYSIAGRTIARTPLDVLRRLQVSLQAEVDRERNPGRFGRPIVMKFTRPE